MDHPDISLFLSAPIFTLAGNLDKVTIVMVLLWVELSSWANQRHDCRWGFERVVIQEIYIRHISYNFGPTAYHSCNTIKHNGAKFCHLFLEWSLILILMHRDLMFWYPKRDILWPSTLATVDSPPSVSADRSCLAPVRWHDELIGGKANHEFPR